MWNDEAPFVLNIFHLFKKILENNGISYKLAVSIKSKSAKQLKFYSKPY